LDELRYRDGARRSVAIRVLRFNAVASSGESGCLQRNCTSEREFTCNLVAVQLKYLRQHARISFRRCIISYNIALCARQTLPATDVANYIEPGIRSVLLMMYHA
jgi:hypothetical protein